MRYRKGMIGLAALVLAGCGQQAPPVAQTPAEAAARAVSLTPKDAHLAELYAQSCKACHTVVDSGAPLTGDATAWAPRLKKGEDALMQSVVGGIGGMPAGGQCFTCTPDDYKALIKFLAGKEA